MSWSIGESGPSPWVDHLSAESDVSNDSACVQHVVRVCQSASHYVPAKNFKDNLACLNYISDMSNYPSLSIGEA